MSDSSTKTNNLFVSDDVRDYIQELYSKQDITNEYTVTWALTSSLFRDLEIFFERIALCDKVDNKNTLKNYLVNMICSDITYSKEKLIYNINEFKNSLGSNTTIYIKNVLNDIEKDINYIIPLNNFERKKFITVILNKYYAIPDISEECEKYNTEVIDVLKDNNTSKKDIELFMNFFTLEQYNTDLIFKLNLKKNNGSEIILLNLLKGDRVIIVDNVNKKCHDIVDLQQHLLYKLLGGDEKMSNYIWTDCENIEFDKKGYIIKEYVIDNEKSNDISEPISDNKSKIDKFGCLNTTNLKRRAKVNMDQTKTWTSLGKKLSTPTIINTPNIFQLLKDTPTNYNAGTYLFGGAVDDSNTKFIKDEDKEIRMQYSYQIVNLLKKALQRLNNNGISLDDATIDTIQTNIDKLKNAEIYLADIAEKIINAGKISTNLSYTDKPMDDEKLKEYVKSHKYMLQSADRTAIKLNSVFIRLLELVNNRGEEIIKAIDDFDKKL
jgi:hypothetical protein